jgi:hypothetical protein
MKRFSVLFLLLCLTIGSIDYIQAETPQRYRHPGRNGIILAWNGSWELGIGSIEGGVGYKRWISERVAIKSFVTFGKVDTTIVYYDNGYPPEHRRKEKSFSLLAGAEDHFWHRGRLSFFFGGAVQFKTSSLKIDYVLYDPHPFETDGVKINKNIFGIQGSLGLEYFFSKRLSLSGQYQIDLSLEKGSRKDTLVGGPGVTQPEKQKITTWNFGTSTSLLILTIYP